MKLGNSKIIKCPYCGTKKELMTLLSGDTFGAQFWSDGKMIASRLPEVSFVQKCHGCGKYYFGFEVPTEKGDNVSFELGTLTYQEWKEAYFQFSNDDEHEGIMEYLKFFLIQAYNDYFRGGTTSFPAQEDDTFIIGIIKEYIDLKDWSITTPLLKAELYREANEMEKCAEVLSKIEEKNLNYYEGKIFIAIKERMEKGDRRVFELEFNE